MALVLGEPKVEGLSKVVGVLREWQYDGAPMQLHPGDLGWFWRFGAEATAAVVRTWSRDGQILAVGLTDGPKLLAEDGWNTDEPWTPLRRDLTEPVAYSDVPVEVIEPERAYVRTGVQQASFDGSTFTDERWQAMAAGLPYADARCLTDRTFR